MKVEQIIMLVIAFLLGYQFKNICGQNVIEGKTLHEAVCVDYLGFC